MNIPMEEYAEWLRHNKEIHIRPYSYFNVIRFNYFLLVLFFNNVLFIKEINFKRNLFDFVFFRQKKIVLSEKKIFYKKLNKEIISLVFFIGKNLAISIKSISSYLIIGIDFSIEIEIRMWIDKNNRSSFAFFSWKKN
jgi:hypothetical protein